MAGIKSVFEPQTDVELYVDYMDTKRSSDETHFQLLHDLYAHKYKLIEFDAIVSSDDPALNFLLQYRDALFPGVPVFFCGINDFHPDLIAGRQLFSGVYETYDVTGTFNLMLRVHPKTKTIVTITDDTVSGHAFQRRIQRAKPEFAGHIQFKHLDNPEPENLCEELDKLPSDALVLWAIYLRTPAGRSISSEASVRMAANASPVPIYCVWDVVGQGVVGGKITSPNFQGKAAAEKATRYLRSGHLENLSVSGSPMLYTFDYNVMQRFDIAESLLPQDSLILNKPYSVYNEYKRSIWVSFGILILLSTIIVFLVYYILMRRQAEQQLRRSEKSFRTMIENLPFAIFQSTGLEQKCSYLNPTFQQFFGYTIEDTPFVSDWFIRAYPDAAYRKQIETEWAEKVKPALQTHLPIDPMETVVTCKDGTQKEILWGYISLGEINYAYGLDLTERKRTASEKERLKEQLIQAQKMESVGQLAGGVAHDFNNKLQIILGHTEIALPNVPQGDPLYGHLIEIQQAALHSADLTRQLLAFARKQVIAPVVLDINAAVEEMLKMLRRLIGEDINLLWEPSTKIWPVKMDSAQVDQILANLCVNARDAIDGTGTVTIKTSNVTLDEATCSGHPDNTPGDYVQLRFSDNGCGIEKNILDHIFEPFFTTKEVGQGTGLGLATLHGIALQNHGFITVDSTSGKGTTFKIHLPRCADKEVETQEATEAKPPEHGHETILLVEDEAVLLNLGQQMLEDLGYIVLAATLPGKALRLAEEYDGKIDLLLTDVIMPEMNGQDLTTQLEKTRPELKHLFMSGYTADVIARNNVLAEGVQFIQKPFSAHELAAKVRQALKG